MTDSWFPGFSPNRAYCENTDTTSPAEGHSRGPRAGQDRPQNPPCTSRGLGGPSPTTAGKPELDAPHTNTQQQDPKAPQGRRTEGAAQEEEAPQHGPAAAKRRRAAHGAAGPRPEPGPGGGLHRGWVGHGVRRWLELGRRRRGVPPAGLPLRGAGQQEGRIWGRELPSHSPGWCPVLRAGGDAAGVCPCWGWHAQLLPRGGCRRGVQPAGGGRLVTEELVGLGARPLLAQPSKPESVLRRGCSALRVQHLFKGMLLFSLCSSPSPSALEAKKK